VQPSLNNSIDSWNLCKQLQHQQQQCENARISWNRIPHVIKICL